MVTFYKPFHVVRIVFCAILLNFFTPVGPAHADNPVFTVEDVEVDVTASNAIEAKQKAFEQAQMDAFEIIAGRMLTEAEMMAAEKPALSTISLLIKDFEVTKEQLSAVRYLGKYTFRFKDDAVRRYFSGQGFKYSDVGSRPVLILPFYQLNDTSTLWSHNNIWMKAWNDAQNLTGLVPVVLPLGDLADMHDLTEDQALSYDQNNLNDMLQRYGAGEAVLALAVPDPAIEAAGTGDQIVSGAISIYLYRTDRAGPEYVQQLQLVSRSETRDQLMNRAVKKVHQELQRDWKSKTMVQSTQNSSVFVTVSFDNLKQWNETQRALEYVAGVSDVVLKSLSPKQAELEIIFQGTPERLRLALEQVNITLAPVYSRHSTGIAAIQDRFKSQRYQLYLNRYAPDTGSYTQTF